jgi:hypothetical protein
VPDLISRFSSRNQRLSHVFLKDRLKGAETYDRIAGYFVSAAQAPLISRISEA